MKNAASLVEENWGDFLAVLKGVMEIPSVKAAPAKNAPYGKEALKAVEYALELGKSWGFETGMVADAMGYVQWSAKEADENYLGIIGHLDVVAAGDGWHYPPFALTENEGVLYGRGILDNKGPIMSCLYALKLLKDQGYQPQKNLRILFGSDEESGMSDILRYLEKEAPPVFGFTPDCKYPVVYGERGVVKVALETYFPLADLAELGEFEGNQDPASVPDALAVTIVNGEKIQASGKRAPSNAPEMGKNAITLLAGKLALVKGLSPSLREYFAWLFASFHDKHYGEGINLALADRDSGKLILTPVKLQKENDRLQLEISFRYPVSFTEKEVMTGIQKALLPGTTVKILRSLPGIMKDPSLPEIQKLTAVYEKATGNSGEPVTTTGGTYARKMPNIVAFGPSFPGQKGIAHNHDEYMAVADLQKNMEIYLEAIVALTKD